MNVGELFVSLGFDVDEQKLKDFDSSIASLEKHMLSLTAVATGSVIGLDVFLTKVADRATAMKQFGDQTGYSTQALQEWALVINRTNPVIGIEQAQEKYKAFTEYVKNINWGAGGGSILSQLGVDYIPGADPAQYVQKLSERLPDFIAKFGRARAGMLLDQIGLGAGSIDALLTTAQQRREMTKGLLLSYEELNHIDRLNSKIAELNQRWERFEMHMADRWGDTLIAAVEKIEAAMERWLPKIDRVAQALGGWQVVGEAVLLYFTTRWAAGMLMAIGRVTEAALVLTTGLLPGALVAGVGAAGAYLPTWLNDKTGWGQSFADWLYPVGPAHPSMPKSPMMPRDLNSQVSNNLTQNIHSSADAGAVGAEAARLWQEWFQRNHLNPTGAGVNLGVNF